MTSMTPEQYRAWVAERRFRRAHMGPSPEAWDIVNEFLAPDANAIADIREHGVSGGDWYDMVKHDPAYGSINSMGDSGGGPKRKNGV